MKEDGAYSDVVLDLDELGFVHAETVGQAAVVQQTDQARTDGVDGGERGDGYGLALWQRAESGEDGADHDLKNHEEPVHCAEQLEADRVLGPLLHYVPVESFRKALGRPIPAGRMDDLMLLALTDGANSVGNTSPFGRGEEAVLDGGAAGLRVISQWRTRNGRGRIQGVGRRWVAGIGWRNWDAGPSLRLVVASSHPRVVVALVGRDALVSLVFAGRRHGVDIG